MDAVRLPSNNPRDPTAVDPQRRLKVDRLFYCVALFLIAEIALSVSTRMARPWQWSALLLLVFVGLICTLVIVRARDTLALRASTVIVIAVLARLPAFFAAPLLDDDYFRFLWDGQQLLAGFSPYASAPSAHFLRLDLSTAWASVLSEINHPDVPTIYGPSLQAVFALAVALGGADPLALKLIFVVADVALVMALLRAGCARWVVVLYVLNPLIVKEIGYSLHPDGVIALSLTLALLALARMRPFQAGVCAAVVVCAKLPLLLLVATLNFKNTAHRKAIFCGALIGAAAYLPFLVPDPMQPFVGLRAFADGWRFNALGYLAFEWLAGAQSRTLLTCCYILAAALMAYAVACKQMSTEKAAVVFLTLILFTAPTVNPWYWMPLLPLAAIVQRHDGSLLLTPWLGSFVLMLGYVNGATLADFGSTSGQGAFSVFPAATVAQCLLMIAGFFYDLRHGAIKAALCVAVRLPVPLSNALIRKRFPQVTQMSARRVLNLATKAQPMLWLDIASAYCPMDLSKYVQPVSSLANAYEQATAFQQQHVHARVVISCAVGYRSSEMAAQLTRAGVAHVANVEGGRRALARIYPLQ